MRLEDEIKHDHFEKELFKAILNILVTADKLSTMTNTALKPYGISKEQFNVLRILRGKHPDPSTIQAITERMISKSSNATRLVEKLRAKGLVRRVQCAHDRRKVDVLITKKGLNLLEEVDPVVAASSNELESNLTENEARELNRLLDKLRE